jgi:hypothetical protein
MSEKILIYKYVNLISVSSSLINYTLIKMKLEECLF